MARAPRHDADKMFSSELRRDRAFQEELSKAWGVEKAPRSFHRMLEKTCESLPPEPIVRVRHLRNFVRGTVGFAAACAAMCLLLLGLNFAVPQLTENLPGVGPAFQALNEYLAQRFPKEIEESEPPEESKPESPAESEAGFAALPVSDNGLTLTGVEKSYQTLTLKVNVPYMGRSSHSVFGWTDAYYLLGTFGFLTCEDGFFTAPEVQPAMDPLQNDTNVLGAFPNPMFTLDNGPRELTYSFKRNNLDFPDKGKVTLTIYESGLWYEWGSRNPVDEGTDGIPGGMEYLGKRVLAEFTLDLETGMAKPSEEYQKEGLTKITPEECKAAQWAPEFTQDGWLAGYVTVFSSQSLSGFKGDYDAYFKVEAFRNLETDGRLDGRAFSLDCYWGEDLVFSADTGAVDDSTVDDYFLDNAITGPHPYNEWFKGGVGAHEYYWHQCVMDESIVGRPVQRIVFAIPIVNYNVEDTPENASALLEDTNLWFRLRDADTGKILLDSLDGNSSVHTINETYSRWIELSHPKERTNSPSPLPADSEGIGPSSSLEASGAEEDHQANPE